MKQSGEVVVGKRKSTRNRTKPKKFQDEVTTIPINTSIWWKSEEKKNANSTSSSQSQKINTSSKPKTRKGKKPSLTTMESKNRPKGGDEVFTDSKEEEELMVKSSNKKGAKSKKGTKKMKKVSGDSSSLKNPHSKASEDLNKKEREGSKQKMAAKLNKLRGCYANDNERSEKKKLMELMTSLEGSTVKLERRKRENEIKAN